MAKIPIPTQWHLDHLTRMCLEAGDGTVTLNALTMLGLLRELRRKGTVK